MKKSGLFQLAGVRVFAGLSLCFLGTVLFLFLAASCSDESSPVGPDGDDGDCIYYEDYLHIAGSCDTPGAAWGVAVSGSFAYVANSDSGLHILPTQCAAPSAVVLEVPGMESRLFDAYPNPFNPSTTISYALPEAAKVSLNIYDVSGRLVQRLVNGDVVDAGRQDTVWRGRDENGRQVAAGMYFYRLEAGEFSETKCMTLVK